MADSNQRIVYDPTEVNVFQLLEDRRVEAQRQTEMLHKRIGDLRDDLYEEQANSHREIMREIKELRKEQQKHANDMDRRLTSLERWKWIVVGGACATGFIIALGMDAIKILS